jgi:hypothetical protein
VGKKPGAFARGGGILTIEKRDINRIEGIEKNQHKCKDITYEKKKRRKGIDGDDTRRVRRKRSQEHANHRSSISPHRPLGCTEYLSTQVQDLAQLASPWVQLGRITTC